jgi:hypothetical protein
VLGVIDFFFFLVGSVNSFNGRSPEKIETAVVTAHLSNASYNNNISSSCLHGWTTLVTTRVIFIALHTTIYSTVNVVIFQWEIGDETKKTLKILILFYNSGWKVTKEHKI